VVLEDRDVPIPRATNLKRKEDTMTTGAMFLLAVGALIFASVIYEGLIKG